MTNACALLKRLLLDRLTIMAKTLLAVLVTSIVCLVLIVVSHAADAHDPLAFTAIGMALSFALLGSLIGTVALSRTTEQVWVSPNWRLLPLTNGRLYLVNQAATLISLVAYWLAVGAGLGLATWLTGTAANWQLETTTLDTVEIGFLFVVLHLFILVFVSCVHMLVTAIQAFLPEGRGRLVTGGLYVLVITLALLALDGVQKLIELPFDRSALTTGLSDTVSYGLSVSSFILVIALMAALSIYLLRRFVEPKVTVRR